MHGLHTLLLTLQHKIRVDVPGARLHHWNARCETYARIPVIYNPLECAQNVLTPQGNELFKVLSTQVMTFQGTITTGHDLFFSSDLIGKTAFDHVINY